MSLNSSKQIESIYHLLAASSLQHVLTTLYYINGGLLEVLPLAPSSPK